MGGRVRSVRLVVHKDRSAVDDLSRLEFLEMRRKVRRIAPVKVWAQRLSVHPVSLSRALSLEPGTNVTSLRRRLQAYLKSWERGEWRFIEPVVKKRFGPRQKIEGWRWEGESEEERRRRPHWELRITEEGVSLVGAE